MLNRKAKITVSLIILALVFLNTTAFFTSSAANISGQELFTKLAASGGKIFEFSFFEQNAVSTENVFQPQHVMAVKTWDGGGITENWSDAANWSPDGVPAAGDTIVFDSTSTKNATIDSNLTLGVLQINSGYAGTISQGASSVTVNGNYTQAAGTFAGGAGRIDFNSSFALTGGTFRASSGTTTFGPDAAQAFSFSLDNGATFDHNSGTAIAKGALNFGGTATTADFNNLEFKQNLNLGSTKTFNIAGDLTLTNGSFFGGTLNAAGNVSIAPTFDGSASQFAILLISGAATRSVTLPTTPAAGGVIPNLKINAPNVSINANGAVTFNGSVELQNAASFANEGNSFVFKNSFVQSGGTLNGGAGTLEFQSGITLNGGTFRASSNQTILGPPDRAAFTLTVDNGVNFDPNGGSMIWRGALNAAGTAASVAFNNVNTTQNFALNDKVYNVNGSLTLTDGSFLNGTLNANGDVFLINTFDGGSGTLIIAGAATRTIAFPSGGVLPVLVINAPNATVTTNNTDTVTFINTVTLQNAASFTNGAGSFVFSNNFTQTGGLFAGGAGNLDFKNFFTLSGGTFQASSATTTFGPVDRSAFTFTLQNGATFDPNGGTAILRGALNLAGSASAVNLHNLEATQNFALGTGKSLNVAGTLGFTDGTFINGTINASGNVSVASTFDGGNGNLNFSGGNDQTFTNNGGLLPTGTWTVNKSAGTVTAATSLILGTTQSLNITNGTLYLNNNSNLTTGNINVGANGKLVNEASTIITLGGNLTNSGVVDLQGGGAACPETDSILIRSSDANQRTWTGNGRYRLVDVDVHRMGGAGTKTVFSGTNTGSNNASWVFNANCPLDLSITPSTTSLQAGAMQTFTAGGGFAPYTFSITTNNSGGSINPATGSYTAGSIIGVTDTIRVTDAFGSTADATVNVFGTPSKLAFTVQPANAVAGQAISPAIQVTVQDASGNTATNSNAAVTLSFSNNPSGATLSGTLTRNAVNGIATFDNLSINRAASGYTLQAASGNLATATSNAFSVSAGAANRLAFVVQPTDTNQSSPIAPPVEVEIQDVFGNRVAATGTITVALGNNPNGAGGLSGTLSKNASGGRAVFGDLRIDTPASGYTLTASSGSLAGATSAAFNIKNPFVVINTNDSGEGSLRQAIINANVTPGTQTISFNIAGTAPFVINLRSNLLNVNDSVVLDATTQSGFNGSPVIEIRKGNIPTSAIAGLNLGGNGNSTVKGFLLTGFNQFPAQAAILINSNNNRIQGNILRNNGIGIQVSANVNLIGGTTPADRNVISGNNTGIAVSSSFNTIKGNFIGVDETGNAAQGNSSGIVISGFISGNPSNNNAVGGAEPGAKNVISGNTVNGIHFLNNSRATILGNFIGTNADRSAAIPNGNGINLQTTGEGSTVGGVASGEGNLIAFNSNHGIVIPRGSFPRANHRIRGNSIHSNGQLGIDLNADGRTLNDSQDPDLGSNLSQNFPNLFSALSFNGGTTVSGRFNSTPSGTFTLDFYANPACTFLGETEGKTYLGSETVSTDATGITGFSATLPVQVPVGEGVTATATDVAGNTSEFSSCQQVSAGFFSVRGRIVDAENNPLPNVLIGVQGVRRSAVTDSNGNYRLDDLPGGADFTLTPRSQNATFSPPSRTFENLSANHLNENFVGTPRATIQGKIESNLGGSLFALGGVSIVLSGAANQTAVTDSNGNYSFVNLAAGNYTVTADKPEFAFTPDSANVTLAGTTQTVNFIGQPPPLDGRIFLNQNGSLRAINPDRSGEKIYNKRVSRRPAVSRDGRKIAFDSAAITVADFDGSNEIAVPNTLADDTAPALSTDGSRIALINRNVAGNRIVVINRNAGGARSVIFNSSNFLSNLDWSPDNTKIAFTQIRNGGRKITVINADGSGNAVQLTASGDNFNPVWSPDGTKIAFLKNSIQGATTGKIHIINAGGTGEALLEGNQDYLDVAFSPDGQRLAFLRRFTVNGAPRTGYGVLNVSGGTTVVNFDNFLDASAIAWSNTPAQATASGTNVSVTAASVEVNFGSVSQAGTTVVTPISSLSSSMPSRFVFGGIGYEISTTAVLTVPPPIAVCFTVPATVGTTEASFNRLAILHSENNQFVDRTISRNFATRRICAEVMSLSPFALAEEADENLPRITGLLQDADGNPIVGATVNLSGAETLSAITGSNGVFSFVNLTAGANYNVQPKRVGYLFEEYSQDFIGLNGEETISFTGVPASFRTSGQIFAPDGSGLAGAIVVLSGAASASAMTDSQGNYTFSNLPADGFLTLTPTDGISNFSPSMFIIEPLTGNNFDVNFTKQFVLPTAANVSVGGRVLTAAGNGVSNARLTLTDQRGETRTALTNSFGLYRFENVQAGETYIISVAHKRYNFTNQVQAVVVVDETEDINFTALP